ncbi:hypothetical protein [Mucilaginibacter sp. OK283]|jgi:hypothetical protein|uniref:hypothetical protein n=1 Tax=Mucilaginibacter sp. OK283 TaxID=1881049 RepID=UPI0008D22737|nr:hypothetical protein [Mucilaginibacter sp. OK283]SEP24446.1 hypothetical protein SAMN05428947_10951 [Mucilaginibacter sp. OK283]
MTSDTYFKFRGRFELFPHRYDIGWPIFTDRIFGLNFFLDKIYKIRQDEARFSDLHLLYMSNPVGY